MAVSNCERPKFASCEFGKCHHPLDKVNTIKKKNTKGGYIKKDHILTGQMVSADHYFLLSLVRLYHTKVKSDPSEMFSGGCILIYHSSVI